MTDGEMLELAAKAAGIDALWIRARKVAVDAGDSNTLYRFAAMVEAATAKRCAAIARGWIEGEKIAQDIEAEFPEAK